MKFLLFSSSCATKKHYKPNAVVLMKIAESIAALIATPVYWQPYGLAMKFGRLIKRIFIDVVLLKAVSFLVLTGHNYTKSSLQLPTKTDNKTKFFLEKIIACCCDLSNNSQEIEVAAFLISYLLKTQIFVIFSFTYRNIFCERRQ